MLSFSEKNGWRIPEHYDADWNPQLEFNADKKDDQFKPYGATPGHGIEWSRLITQWAISTYGWDPATHTVAKEAQPYVDAAQRLFARAVADGWCADGEPGLVYTTDWQGKPVVHDRMHWTIAEGVDASATLYRATGRDFFRSWYATFNRFVDEHLADHVNGSWRHQMDAHNHVLRTLAGQVRPLPRVPVHAHPVQRPGALHRDRRREERVTGRETRTDSARSA